MNQDFIECGYFYKDSHSYTIAIDKDLKKHYFSNDKGKKRLVFLKKKN